MSSADHIIFFWFVAISVYSWHPCFPFLRKFIGIWNAEKPKFNPIQFGAPSVCAVDSNTTLDHVIIIILFSLNVEDLRMSNTFPIWRCLPVKRARRYCLFTYIVISAAPRSAPQHGGHALVTTEVNLVYNRVRLLASSIVWSPPSPLIDYPKRVINEWWGRGPDYSCFMLEGMVDARSDMEVGFLWVLWFPPT